jgi:pimeloyl-ACP methyl ester carboxylesterase
VDAIPGAELRLIPDTGHMLPQDSVETFNRLVIEFLTKHVKNPIHLGELSE